MPLLFFFFNDTATTEIYTLSLHDALPIQRSSVPRLQARMVPSGWAWVWAASARTSRPRSAADSLGLAGSAITRKRNRATCSAGSSKPDGRVVGTATSYEGGGRGTGGSQRHPPRPAQGGLVVAPSHPPPLTMVASGQVAGAAAPSRCLTRAASAPSAAKVAHWGTPGGPSTSPPSSTSSAHSPATSTGARTPNRRHQSRTVVCGTPSPAATGRTPTPATTRSSAAPITQTTSTRRSSKNDGSSACVTPHGRHLARATHTRHTRPRRTYR